MAYFAQINDNNIVQQVIVADHDYINSLENSNMWVETSLNTVAGIYYNSYPTLKNPDQSKAFRKNYAGIGYTYDPQRDAFIPPKPYQSWVIDEFSCTWKPPIPYPTDTNTEYFWDETILNWKPITGDSND